MKEVESMQVKINNKNYEVPQLGFKEMAKIEQIAEASIVTVFNKQQIFILAEAFVGCVVGCNKEEAGELCEQHILSGGKLEDIYLSFSKAVNESGFFKKLLGLEEEKKMKRSSTISKTEEQLK